MCDVVMKVGDKMEVFECKCCLIRHHFELRILHKSNGAGAILAVSVKVLRKNTAEVQRRAVSDWAKSQLCTFPSAYADLIPSVVVSSYRIWLRYTPVAPCLHHLSSSKILRIHFITAHSFHVLPECSYGLPPSRLPGSPGFRP